MKQNLLMLKLYYLNFLIIVQEKLKYDNFILYVWIFCNNNNRMCIT